MLDALPSVLLRDADDVAFAYERALREYLLSFPEDPDGIAVLAAATPAPPAPTASPHHHPRLRVPRSGRRSVGGRADGREDLVAGTRPFCYTARETADRADMGTAGAAGMSWRARRRRSTGRVSLR